ncbi:MAG: nickel pincer cofactor biosynthesis protein LarB [Planctomycetes bacterium]|nr:nickel pincer cofactor biosynthesis protein LarB [Planctomycetota bacterium]MCP4770962.1 nickel pincer cofactor biosynthesis protein LarB [Planctomycetota bacterium]MCP4861681.1 nickel pincer cofactor biosynthesis protein LarB [Planctomycetota bacterium]
MDRKELRDMLEAVRNGELTSDDALECLAQMPVRHGEHTVADTHRELRCGVPEVIYAAGKTPEQCASAAKLLSEAHDRVLLTKADATRFEAVQAILPQATFHAEASCITWYREPQSESRGFVLVLAAGTSDLQVAAEAQVTLQWMGVKTELITDIGVAGLHRLLPHVERLRTADCLVVAAGMEGALPSVVAGLVACPLVAVPTSVGYGASFQGLTALLAMLNSCAPGIGVVNIDNGFGAGLLAAKIAKSAHPLH